MTTDQIRARFLRFFEARDHKIVPSDSLIPAKDPSILFTGAGMNQFKEEFMGRDVTYRRAASSQKCLRTADLENVGATASHHTFFEMLGNFSFGDYFKKEAIAWAWEFLTQDLKIPKERLSVSVYEEDDEAREIWLKDIRIPPSKLLKLGDKENFWPSEAKKNGPNGPCGPCSEILYFDAGRAGEPVEVWNLVFTQFNRKEGGVLEDLPSKNIDTGMGLERLASVMQGVDTNFEIDIFIPIIQAIKRELNPVSNFQFPVSSINAIADHIRAITFAISDGVYPSNEERGFVVRKLIRRSIQRAMQLKHIKEPFLYKLVPAVAKVMKAPYPELERAREAISQIVKAEEERFHHMLTEVVPAMKREFIGIKRRGEVRIPGELVFRYSDEKGVPFDLQKELAQALGLSIDIEAFNKFLKEQKERSRAKSRLSKEIFAGASGLAMKEEEWDEVSKQNIRMNHTATHLLHAALRRVLGEHARQSGSLVYPDRLRFDFTHPKKLEKNEIEKIEEFVNKDIADGHKVKREVMKLEEAKREGAIALFGEKYGEDVVVRTIGNFSKELCSGDHIDSTKKIGLFKIVQEGSISAGTRRIEAVTGDEVYNWLLAQVAKLNERVKKGIEGLKGRVRLKGGQKILEIEKWLNKKNKDNLIYEDIKQWSGLERELLDLLEEVNSEKKKISKELIRQKQEASNQIIDTLLKNAKEVKGIKIIAGALKEMDMTSLRSLSDSIAAKMAGAVILLVSDFGGKANLIMAVSKDLVKKGVNAQELIKPIAACVGGSGGGRPDLAQAGGKDVSRINEALSLIYALIKETIR